MAESNSVVDPTLNDPEPPEVTPTIAPATKTTSEAAASAATPPAPPKHSDRVLAQARALGISDEEIESMSPAVLIQEIRLLKLEQNDSQLRASLAPKTAPVPAAAPVDDEREIWGVDPETNKQLTEKDFHPSVARMMKKAYYAEKENKALKDQLQQQAQRAQAENAFQTFMRVFAERPDLFGKNPAANPPGSPESARQHAVKGVVQGLQHRTTLEADIRSSIAAIFGAAQAALPGANQTPPAAPSVTERVVDVAAGDRPRDPTTGRFLTAAEYEAAALNAPTHRLDPEPAPGPELAQKQLVDMLRRRGHYIPANNGDQLDGVPE